MINIFQVVSIWHSHLGSLVEQMVASHRKEAEQGAELSPRPSFPSKSGGSGHSSHQLGKLIMITTEINYFESLKVSPA
jgi:hypothetical protein